MAYSSNTIRGLVNWFIHHFTQYCGFSSLLCFFSLQTLSMSAKKNAKLVFQSFFSGVRARSANINKIITTAICTWVSAVCNNRKATTHTLDKWSYRSMMVGSDCWTARERKIRCNEIWAMTLTCEFFNFIPYFMCFKIEHIEHVEVAKVVEIMRSNWKKGKFQSLLILWSLIILSDSWSH